MVKIEDKLNFINKRKNYIFFIIGFLFFSYVKAPIEFIINGKNYKVCEAFITKSKLDSKEEKGKITFIPEIEFKYTVENKKYKSDKVSFAVPEFKNEKEAEDYINKYPVNKKVADTYNPKDPQNALIDTTINADIILKIFLGIGTTLLGFFAYIMKKIIQRILISVVLLNSGCLLVWNSLSDFQSKLNNDDLFSLLNSSKMASGAFITMFGLKYIKPLITELRDFFINWNRSKKL